LAPYVLVLGFLPANRRERQGGVFYRTVTKPHIHPYITPVLAAIRIYLILVRDTTPALLKMEWHAAWRTTSFLPRILSGWCSLTESRKRKRRGPNARGKNAPAPALLTVGQVASLLNAHSNTVRRWAQQGLLNPYRVGPRGDRRFRPDDVESFLLGKSG